MKQAESELAKKFVEYFEKCGYECYKEVEYVEGRIDIVATDGKLRIACEVKNTASLQVLAQAICASRFCHYSYIGVPRVTSNFYGQICEKFNIGTLEVMRHGEVWERWHPILNRRVLPLTLHEFQKESVAGGVAGEQMTKFKMTVRDIVHYVEKHPDAKFSDVLNEVKTHYHSISTAKASIRQWVNRGIIKEFTIEKGVVKLIVKKDVKNQT